MRSLLHCFIPKYNIYLFCFTLCFRIFYFCYCLLLCIIIAIGRYCYLLLLLLVLLLLILPSLADITLLYISYTVIFHLFFYTICSYTYSRTFYPNNINLLKLFYTAHSYIYVYIHLYHSSIAVCRPFSMCHINVKSSCYMKILFFFFLSCLWLCMHDYLLYVSIRICSKEKKNVGKVYMYTVNPKKNNLKRKCKRMNENTFSSEYSECKITTKRMNKKKKWDVDMRWYK